MHRKPKLYITFFLSDIAVLAKPYSCVTLIFNVFDLARIVRSSKQIVYHLNYFKIRTKLKVDCTIN